MKKYCSVLVAAAVLLLCGCPKEKKVAKSPSGGKVTLESSPAGAEVFVGSKSFGKTPLTLSGVSGTHRARLEKTGYQTKWVNLATESGKKKTVTVTLPEQGTGVLVSSGTDAVEVSMGGRSLGVTPLIVPDLMPGRYELKFSKPGYAARSAYLNVDGLRPQRFMVNLVSNVGRVQLTSRPSKARLIIDGKSFGFTPFIGTLTTGMHRVRLEKPGVMPMEEVIEVSSGKLFRKEFVMPAAPGSMNVVTHPVGAKIRLDGRVVGTSPLTLRDLPAGKYTVSAELAGFSPEDKLAEVLPDAVTRVDFALSNSHGAIHLSVVPAGVSVYLNNKYLGKVKSEPGAAVNRTVPITINNLSPGVYRVTVAHELGDPERKHVDVRVRKGRTSRPEPIYLWVPNAEVKWKVSGKVETGMLYSETDERFVFGADKGIRTDYNRKEAEYIRKLDINDSKEK